MNILIGFVLCILALAVLYFLMITPRMIHRPDMEELQKWYYAHRGLHDAGAGIPENSMEAFGRAVDAGYGIELDVQMTKDGVPVVFHDFTLKRMCGAEGKVCDYTFEELEQFRLLGTDQKIPKFQDVLGLVGGRTPLIVELKIERTDLSVCAGADRLLAEYGGLYCIESFNPLGVLWYRRNRKRIVRGQLSDAFLKEGSYVGVLYFLLQNLLFNWLGKPDFIAYNCKYPRILSRKLCHGFYRAAAVAWTVRSPEELERIRKSFDIYIFENFRPEGKKRA